MQLLLLLEIRRRGMGMKVMLSLLALFLVVGVVSSVVSSNAADICQAVALTDVPALDSPDPFVLKRGDYDTGITQYRVNKKTGETSFCSHGGACFPTHVVENGNRVQALRLVNCKVSQKFDAGDPDEVVYELDVVREDVSATELQINDLDDKLIEMGLCFACARHVANLYVKEPASRCAELTRKALQGDPAALEQLKESPSYCD